MRAISSKNTFSFLQGGGEMGERTRAYNWSQTSLGSPEYWPQSLRTTVSIILSSKFPMFLWWGNELLQFYNDAYRPSLGNDGKHPTALGQRGEECWPEIWPIIKPLINQVLSGGEATWSEDQLIPIYRNGKLEDVYWTFGYSPVNDEAGKVGGVLVVCTETTEKVIGLHRLEESKDELKFAVEATELGTWDYNPLTNNFKGNSRLKEWFGLLPDEDIELALAINVIAENDRQRVTEAIQKSLQYSSGGVYDIEYTIVHPITIEPRIVRAKGRAWFNNEKIAFRFDGTLQDITEQVTTRKNIVENEARFRSLIEAATIPMCLYIGRELKIELVNEALLETWGRDRSVIGKVLKEALPELEGQPFLQLLDDVFTSGIPYSVKDAEAKVIRDGVLSVDYFDLWYKPMFNAANEVYGILATGIDVTEKLLSQKKIEESERNLRNVILQAPVAMCILRGPQHVIEIANDRMFKLWGKDLEEVIAKPLFQGVPESKDQGFEALLANVYETGETYKANGVPVNLLRRNGIETVYLDFVFEAFKESNGSISGVMAVAIEVTEQVLSRQKIESSETRFRLMADTMPQFVWTSDAEGNLNYYNQAVFDYSGLSYEQIQKDGWLQIVHPDDREENIKLWMHAIQTGENFLFQHRFKYIDGNYRWQLSRAVPQRDSQGVIQLWIGTSTDIHEQKLFEEELARQVQQRTEDLKGMNEELTVMNQEIIFSNDKLLRSNEELAQFTYAASHDMQEPLRKVHTFSSFLIDNNAAQLDERGKTYLSKINTSVQRMKSIIDDLLNYSLQTREEQQFEPVDLNRVIGDVEADLELTIQQKKATILKDKFPRIKAVATQMNQLFFNLFSNALKFSKPDVPVKIEIRFEYLTNDDLPQVKGLLPKVWYIKISFCDNGIGFEQYQAVQIFSLFKRLHGKSEYEGTGIGLGLCKKIVQNHQGVIWAESEVDKGAQFYIVLPV